MSTKQLNSTDVNVIDLPASATVAARPAEDNAAEEAVETIAVPNGNDEESAAFSSDTESNISSDAAVEDARQQRTAYVKCGGSLVMAAAALGALAVIGAGPFHLAGRPTKNFSSSKQVAVAVASGEIKIKGFTFVGDGNCKDSDRHGPDGRGGTRYDFLRYEDVASAEACARLCSACPGGGQTGNNGEKLVLRGFEYRVGSVCDCLVDNVAEGDFPVSLCQVEGAGGTNDEYEGYGEIESSSGIEGYNECWKVNSKSSKSSKSGSKGGKRG